MSKAKEEAKALAIASHEKRARRAVRVRLLNEEVDKLNDAATERSKSVDGKSSFLAIAAGIVVTASTTHAWHSPWFEVTVPMFFAALALAAATVALRPGRRLEVTASLMVAKWLDSELSTSHVEEHVLLAKVGASKIREDSVRRRALVTTVGFVMLVISVVSLVVVFAIDLN